MSEDTDAKLGFAPDQDRSLFLRDQMITRHAQHEYAVTNFFVLTRRP